MKAFWDFVSEHKRMILGGAAGLLVGILLLTVGFFGTLLIAALVVLGAVLAGVPGAWEKIVSFVSAFFRKIFKGNK